MICHYAKISYVTHSHFPRFTSIAWMLDDWINMIHRDWGAIERVCDHSVEEYHGDEAMKTCIVGLIVGVWIPSPLLAKANLDLAIKKKQPVEGLGRNKLWWQETLFMNLFMFDVSLFSDFVLLGLRIMLLLFLPKYLNMGKPRLGLGLRFGRLSNSEINISV